MGYRIIPQHVGSGQPGDSSSYYDCIINCFHLFFPNNTLFFIVAHVTWSRLEHSIGQAIYTTLMISKKEKIIEAACTTLIREGSSNFSMRKVADELP